MMLKILSTYFQRFFGQWSVFFPEFCTVFVCLCNWWFWPSGDAASVNAEPGLKVLLLLATLGCLHAVVGIVLYSCYCYSLLIPHIDVIPRVKSLSSSRKLLNLPLSEEIIILCGVARSKYLQMRKSGSMKMFNTSPSYGCSLNFRIGPDYIFTIDVIQ